MLGPARDGGYYLLGMAGVVAPIFDDIDWSTSRVLRQTIERLEQHGIASNVLPEWYDVDDADDLQLLQRQRCDEATVRPLRSQENPGAPNVGRDC